MAVKKKEKKKGKRKKGEYCPLRHLAFAHGGELFYLQIILLGGSINNFFCVCTAFILTHVNPACNYVIAQ